MTESVLKGLKVVLMPVSPVQISWSYRSSVPPGADSAGAHRQNRPTCPSGVVRGLAGLPAVMEPASQLSEHPVQPQGQPSGEPPDRVPHDLLLSLPAAAGLSGPQLPI